MMNKVFIIDAKRSPIGSYLGSLRNVTAPELGAQVLKGMLAPYPTLLDKVDEVVLGNILPAGVKQGIGRQVSIGAGLSKDIPAYAVNMVCGSGMKSVMNAYANILSGIHRFVIAGGVESMSNAPYILPSQVRDGVRMGDIGAYDHMIYDALTDAFTHVHMGITAENIVDKHNITREAQDQFAIESQTKAIAAVDAGKFKDEIIPIVVKSRKEEVIVDTDEYPNRKTSLEKLATLRPAFKKDGSVTAGSSSGINDGASFVMVASEDFVKENNLTAMVEIVGIGQGGVDPQTMGLGPVPAIRQALKHSGLRLSDIDLFELNEAFASQAIGVLAELEEEHDMKKEDILAKCNVNGGAIALGHPVGASGNRIIVTLIHEMKKRNLTYGLASLCIGGGMGTAIILKNIKS